MQLLLVLRLEIFKNMIYIHGYIGIPSMYSILKCNQNFKTKNFTRETWGELTDRMWSPSTILHVEFKDPTGSI